MPALSVPKLTAVLVNYNHARFIPQSLGSLLAQTRPADELIVIDDASTDDSVSVISNLLAGRANASLVRNAHNIGCVPTMNRGVELAQGDLIFFAAADDIFYPRLFATAVELASTNPTAGLFSARSDIIDENGQNRALFDTPMPLSEPGYISPQEAARQLQRDDSWFMGNTTVYCRSFVIAEGKFNAELGPFADGFMARVLALKHGACFTPHVLGAWRRVQGGMAWTQAMSADQTEIFAKVKREFEHSDGLFPPGYFERWKGRAMFGARRFAMSLRRQNSPGDTIFAQLGARISEYIKIGWLFLRLRPWDVWPVLCRRFSHLLHRR